MSMASPFIIRRVEGDHPVRGSEDTVTRIYYQSPPPRTAITRDNDGDGLSSRKLIYEDRGVSGVLQSTTYPRSKALTLLARESLDKPVVCYQPRHTPPDSFEAQDHALHKAEILLHETQRAMGHSRRAEVTKTSRRDSAVSEDEEIESQRKTAAPELGEVLADDRSQEQLAHATTVLPQVLTTIEPQIIVTSTEPHSPRKDEACESSKRQKLTPSSKSRSPALHADAWSLDSRARSGSQFVKPKPPTAAAIAGPSARGDSVASVRSTDSRSSRQSRSATKDDLTIDSKFGQDAEDPNEIECLDKNGKWYVVIGEGLPDWAIDSRPKTKVVASPHPRRGTGAWRNNQ